MSFTVSDKGQVTIAKEIRDQLGVQPGWRAIQRRVEDHVEIHFLPPRHRRSLQGSLAPGGRAPTTQSEEQFAEACENAWGQAASEEFVEETHL